MLSNSSLTKFLFHITNYRSNGASIRLNIEDLRAPESDLDFG